MNIVDKFILKRAEAINTKLKDKEAAILKKREEQEIKYKIRENNLKELRSLINAWYDKEIEKFDINAYYLSKTGVELDFGVGNIAIVNYFSLRLDSDNHWDSGASGLLSRGGFGRDRNPKPLNCVITDIRVSKSFATELIDSFMDNHNYELLMGWKGNIVEQYKEWLSKWLLNRKPLINPIIDNNGLYVEALFNTIDFDFQPTWGLNIFSFLSISSNDGKETVKVWEETYVANKEIIRLRELIDEMKNNITTLHSNITKGK